MACQGDPSPFSLFSLIISLLYRRSPTLILVYSLSEYFHVRHPRGTFKRLPPIELAVNGVRKSSDKEFSDTNVVISAGYLFPSVALRRPRYCYRVVPELGQIRSETGTVYSIAPRILM
jgi:hypothetical protein